MAAITAGIKRKYHDLFDDARNSPTTGHRQVQPSSHPAWSGINSASRSSSGTRSPDDENAKRGQSRLFDSNASVVIIGVRGVGKSSLAVLASSAYGRRLIEIEKVFQEETGVTPSNFRKIQGSAAFHEVHGSLFKHTLQRNSEDCVIVCSFSDLEKDGARVLREFARSHPVIHVTRDLKGIQSYVQLWSEEKVSELVRVSNTMLRACTNFEFYNISENMERTSPNSDHSGQPLTRLARGPFLTLKRAEHDFLRLLRNVLGDNARHSSHQSAYPLSKVRLEDLEYPSAVRLSVTDIVSNQLDLDDAQIGVDAIELEITLGPDEDRRFHKRKQLLLDMISESFAILRRTTILPIIVSIVETPRAGTRKIESADVIEQCLRLGPEYCRIALSSKDSSLAHWLANRGRVQLIGSLNVAQRYPLGWEDPRCTTIYEDASRAGFDFVEMAMPAQRVSDSFDALTFAAKFGSKPVRMNAYCTGTLGRTSLLFNTFLTPVQYPSQPFKHPDSVTVEQRNRALFSSLIYSPLKFLIYGQNVSFSLSPAMHNAAYRACGMSHTFEAHSASNLDDFARLIRGHGFGGSAIVQPFKTSAIRYLDQLSPQARVIGAVNTVIPVRDNELVYPASDSVGLPAGRNRSGPVKALYGDNTDWIGIRACIRRSLSPANTVRAQTTAVVCGAGGMARAGVYALITLGVKTIFVCNRTRRHAEHLAEHYNRLITSNDIASASLVDTSDVRINVIDSFDSTWPQDTRHPTIIVSCIPTQTIDGDAINFTIPPSWLQNPTAGVVVEVRALADKGWILTDGLDVLPEQAFAQFELFTGKRAPRKLMRDVIFKNYNEDTVPLHGALNTDSPSHS